MARPGIMVYFDMMGPLKVLSDADKGRLFWAMLEYGQTGIEPAFDGLLALAWEFVKPKIDKDSEEYNRTVLKRQYATFCRDRKRKGEPDISFEEWLITVDNQNYQMVSCDTKCYPTTITNTKTITASATAAEANATAKDEGAAAATDERKVIKPVGGTLGKGVVFLSDEQFDDLLEKMGLDVLNRYIDRLSSFIIRENASVYNHYETMLDWWRKDSRVQ
jgi:hypothetical protein